MSRLALSNGGRGVQRLGAARGRGSEGQHSEGGEHAKHARDREGRLIGPRGLPDEAGAHGRYGGAKLVADKNPAEHDGRVALAEVQILASFTVGGTVAIQSRP